MCSSLRILIAVASTMACLFSQQCFAIIAAERTPGGAANNEFIAPYGTNSLMFKKTSGDDNASEINISMGFYFKKAVDGGHGKTSYEKVSIWGFNPFFSYTGRYDFYWIGRATRTSAPVISRFQNPALHFENKWGKETFGFAFEHFSNGQAFDASKNKQQVIDAYNTLDKEESRALIDSISRVAASMKEAKGATH